MSIENRRRIDVICNQFEESWSAGKRPAFASFLDQEEPDLRGPLLRALLEVDIDLRSRAGLVADPNEYGDLGDDAIVIVRELVKALALRQVAIGAGEATTDIDPNRVASNKTTTTSKQIGPYKLLQLLGEGGMGTVWMAGQEKPVKRRVALKVIKAGVASREVITRFEAERQALSLMNHSNIARILDVGTTPDGQPYFAMELVQGMPLTNYCDNNKVGIRDRLQLFAEVCSGVQHAHQKGIIHRDLKPSNILVAIVEGKPAPKIIDFGLAKALESTQRLTDQSLFTGIGQILGTLKYMSPEQASLDLVDIDTRTDIYSLGVILYELLTGSTPLDNETVRGEAILKVLQVIRDSEPAKPSSRLSTDKATLASITNLRQTDSSSLSRILVGDLDWVVVKALEKDRSRRYESASDLAADIRRFLNNEPVVARPPSAIYRVRKFVRKNRVMVIVSALLTVALIAGITGTTLGMLRARTAEELASDRFDEAEMARVEATAFAERERLANLVSQEQTQLAKAASEAERRAREQATNRLAQVEKSNEILTNVFEDLDVFQARDPAEPIEAILANRLILAGQQLEEELIDNPLAIAKLQLRLGKSLLALGFPGPASELFEKTYKTFESELGANDMFTFASMNNLAISYKNSGDLGKAFPIYERCLALMQQSLGEDHADTMVAMNNLALAFEVAGQLDKALPLYEKALELIRNKLGPNSHEAFACMNNLAVCYKYAGLHTKALALFLQALELSKTLLGPEHGRTLMTMSNLGDCYLAIGQLDEALPILEQSLELKRKTLGSVHPETMTSMNNLAACLLQLGSIDEAIRLHGECLELRKTKLGLAHPETLNSMSALASAYRAIGKFDNAIRLLNQAMEILKAKHGVDHPDWLMMMNSLAMCYRDDGRLELAIPLFEQSLELRSAKFGADHPSTLIAMTNLADAYSAKGNFDRAIAMLDEAVALATARLGPDHIATVRIVIRQARCLQSSGQHKTAITILESALPLIQSTLGKDHSESIDVMADLAKSFSSTSQSDRAIALLSEGHELLWNRYGEDHFVTLRIAANLATHYQNAGRTDEAIALYEKAYSSASRFPVLGKVSRSLLYSYSVARNPEKATRLVEEILVTLRAQYSDDPGGLAEPMTMLAALLIDAGANESAEMKLKESLAILERHSPDSWRIFETRSLIGNALLSQLQYEKCAPFLLGGYEGLKKRHDSKPEDAVKQELLKSIDRLMVLAKATNNEKDMKKWEKEKRSVQEQLP